MIGAIYLFAAVVAAFELSVVWKVKPLYRVITETTWGPLLGIGFSIALSVFFAGLFGAAGTIAMGGAVLGTIITAATYKLHLIELTIALWDFIVALYRAVGRFVDSIRETLLKLVHAWRETRESIRNAYHTTKRVGTAVRHPIRSVRS